MTDEPLPLPSHASLRRRLSTALIKRGFRRDHGMHATPLNEEFALLVDVGPLDGKRSVAPFVGLRHEATMELLSRLRGRAPHAFDASAGGNAGRLRGGRYVDFPASASVDAVLEAIDQASDVLRRYASLDHLPYLFDEVPVAPPNSDFMAALGLVRRDREMVLHWLAVGEAGSCRKPDEICEAFRRFQRAVLAELP